MTDIRHQALALNWAKTVDIANPRTLVLGSFNPYNPRCLCLDYYYGRETNFFWRTIANIIGQDEDYFFDKPDGLNRKISVMNSRFCCLDVINEIEFSCEDDNCLEKYLQKKIFKKFSDQNIWVSNTSFLTDVISLKRTYNPSILEAIRKSTSIKKVIHTMGTNRIKNKELIYPDERNPNQMRFRKFMMEIIETCEQQGIEFVFYSLSPSGWAVNNGATDKNDLKRWLKQNLYFD
jgi:hypothetical protein